MIRVATGGCFDIIHAGHIDLLRRANKFGTLEVYLNSNESIRRLKGDSRPINNEACRRLVLESIKYVDFVLTFEEDTPCNLIRSRRPDIWVKGGDYKIEDLPEAKVVQSYGGEVVILPFRIDISTSKIIEKINAL